MSLQANTLHSQINNLLTWLGADELPWAYSFTAVLAILLFAWCALLLGKFFIDGKLTRIVLKTPLKWDDELHKYHFFKRCSHIVPGLTIYFVAPLLFEPSTGLYSFFVKGSTLYLLLVFMWATSAILNTVEGVYNGSGFAKRAPITGFIQVAKLLLSIVTVLMIVAQLTDKSPLLLISGLGAVTAVLLLVFRDAILGFVAGIQIAANRMVNTGDWIEMPKYGADGSVLAVGLTTVKVQNWDNTISTIPTYSLITDSVKNWRGMSESDGRRIKRAINIDLHSITFLDESAIEKLRSQRLLGPYLESKKEELSQFHKSQTIHENDELNTRRLTNLGTFRAYVQAYIEQHPYVNQESTVMARQLAPTEFGVPLEVYCFSLEKNWVKYEAIQSDIFDHLISTLPLFGLRAYQRISDAANKKPQHYKM